MLKFSIYFLYTIVLHACFCLESEVMSMKCAHKQMQSDSLAIYVKSDTQLFSYYFSCPC